MGRSRTDPETGIDDDIDDEAWKKLFLRLTGGHEEAAALTNGKNTNLSPKESLPRNNSKHDSLGLLAPPAGSLSRLSLSRLSITRLGATPLPDLKDRTIDLDTLEKYIMGVKDSYKLEIEYGIPRSQLCKAVRKMKLADKDNNGQIGGLCAIKVYKSQFSLLRLRRMGFLLPEESERCPHHVSSIPSDALSATVQLPPTPHRNPFPLTRPSCLLCLPQPACHQPCIRIGPGRPGPHLLLPHLQPQQAL